MILIGEENDMDKTFQQEKIVLLDFCGTVADFQTFVPYIESVLEHAGRTGSFYRFIKIGAKITDRIFRLFNDRHYFYKDTLVKLTRGISLQDFNIVAKSYYTNKVKPHLIHETLNIIKEYRKNGYRIILLSAACMNYLAEFAEQYEIYDVLSTEVKFKNDKSLGRYKTKDCIRDEKVHRIVEYFGGRKEFDVGISDSKSDIPMLNICKKQIIISKNNHQSWVKSDMEEIIYEY